MLCVKAGEVLEVIGEAVKCAFREFELKVEVEASETIVKNGDIHPLATHVMNYLTLVLDYKFTMTPLTSY